MRPVFIIAALLLVAAPAQARSPKHQPLPHPQQTLPIVNLNPGGVFLGLVRPEADKGPLLDKAPETDWTGASAPPAGAHFRATVTAHDEAHATLAREGLGGADILGDTSSSTPLGRQAKIMLVLPTEP